MAKAPGFFKFFYPDTSSERLPLPEAYSQIFERSTPGVAYLRNSDGQMWQVILAKEGDNWYFQDGWKELVQTANVEAGDFFLFDFAGDAIFDFILCGANRCNKSTSCGQKEEVENREVGEEDARRQESGGGFRARRQKKQQQTKKSNNGLSPKKYRLRRRRGQTEEEGNEVGEIHAQLQEEKRQRDQQKIDSVENEEVGEEYAGREESGGFRAGKQKKQELTEKSSKRSRTQDKRRDKGKSIIEDEDTEDIEYLADKDPEPKRIKKGRKSKGKANVQAEDAPPSSDSEEDDYFPEKDHEAKERKQRSKSQSKRRKRIAEEESIFQHGVISRPQNPYFIAKIWKRKPCDLCIPRDVVDNYKVQLPGKLVVVDERKTEWEAKVRKWGDGRIWISQGWKAFCQVNNMSLEDRCLCEFIQQGEDLLYLKLRILRREGGSWLPEATVRQEAQKNLQAVADQPPREDRFFTKKYERGRWKRRSTFPSQ